MNNIVLVATFGIPLFALLFNRLVYKYYQKTNSRKLSGCDMAHELLNKNKINRVHVIEKRNTMFSLYVSKKKVIRLSSAVFHDDTLSALVISAFEAQHAIMDKEDKAGYKIKASIEPLLKYACYCAYILIIIAILINNLNIIEVGLAILFFVLLFYLLTIYTEIHCAKDTYVYLQEANFIQNKIDIIWLLIAKIIEPFSFIITNIVDLFKQISN